MHPDSHSMCRLGESVALPPEGGCSGCTALAIDRLHLLAKCVSRGISDLACHMSCLQRSPAACAAHRCQHQAAPHRAACSPQNAKRRHRPCEAQAADIPVLRPKDRHPCPVPTRQTPRGGAGPRQPLVVQARKRGVRQGLAQQFGVPEPVHRTACLFEEICRLEPEALTCTSSPKLPLHALQLRVHLSQPCPACLSSARLEQTCTASCMHAGLRGAP